MIQLNNVLLTISFDPDGKLKVKDSRGVIDFKDNDTMTITGEKNCIEISYRDFEELNESQKKTI